MILQHKLKKRRGNISLKQERLTPVLWSITRRFGRYARETAVGITEKAGRVPPAVGTLAECRERIGRYENMLLFSSKYDLEDSFDFEGMHASLHKFKQTVASFRSDIQKLLPRYLLLSNEGCGQCETCTYPHAPCRFPEQLCHSLEGYGFLVSELAKSAGMHYHNGANTVTYFGALLF